jgi:plastocyanin
LAAVAGTVILAASSSAGCSATENSAATAKPSGKATVVITDGAYVPARVQVALGERVTWVNRDQAPNTVESGGTGFFEFNRDKLDARNLFDLHTFQQGEAESVEFDTAGTYEYGSSFNSDMKGVVEVVERDG